MFASPCFLPIASRAAATSTYSARYSLLFESNLPIVVQHTRLDSMHTEGSLLSAMAYGEIAARRTVRNARLWVVLFP
jgi:hypothetical protein